MILIKILLRWFGLLFRMVGLWMPWEYTWRAGFITWALLVGVSYALPKSKKKQEEDEIRRLQIAELKKKI